jgi:hypothetical protein
MKQLDVLSVQWRQKEAAVPRYFFHVDDGGLQTDQDGTELSGIEEAQAEAVLLAGAMLKELDREFWTEGVHWTMHVTDERRRLLFSLHFSAEIPSGAIMYFPN